MANTNPHDEPWPEHKETFDVVMIKLGVSIATATPTDFKRARVEASSTWAACAHADVTALADWRPLQAVKPGEQTQEEVLARQREIMGEQKPVDRASI